MSSCEGKGRLGQAAVGIQESRHGGDVSLPFMGRTTDKGHIRIRIRNPILQGLVAPGRGPGGGDF